MSAALTAASVVQIACDWPTAARGSEVNAVQRKKRTSEEEAAIGRGWERWLEERDASDGVQGTIETFLGFKRLKAESKLSTQLGIHAWCSCWGWGGSRITIAASNTTLQSQRSPRIQACAIWLLRLLHHQRKKTAREGMKEYRQRVSLHSIPRCASLNT